MKRSKTQWLRSLAAVMLLGAGLASCSQDDFAGKQQGDPLPPGKYPLMLTASVDGMQTRSAGKNSWTGNDTEYIGVRMGDDGIPARYVIGNGNSVRPASDDQTLYWQNTKSATITAWYPYDAQTNVNISDQKDDFAAFDFLTATAEGADYKTSVTLKFNHRMAKVKYTLLKGDGITDDELKGATVQIAGFTKASFINGKLDGNTDGWITPTTSDHEALLVPQNMINRQFIKVTVGKDASEREFYYIPTTDAAGILTAGKVNTYNITVKRTGLEVSEISASWEDEETEGKTKEPIFRVYMPTGHGQNLTYSNNVTQQSGYLEVKGNPFTISYAVTEDELQNGFSITEGIGTVARQINESHDIYTFTYTLRSDVHLAYTLYAGIGDYYYSDGTWLPYHDDGKTCIGIVFKSGAGNGDHASNYNNELIDNTIHGYVVALTDAVETECQWGHREHDTPLVDLPLDTLENADYNGYLNTKTIIERYTISAEDYNTYYRAFHHTLVYRSTVPVPLTCSGWYLPSLKQLADVWDIYKNEEGCVLYDRLKALSSEYLFKEPKPGERGEVGGYWSSTERSQTDAWCVQMTTGYRKYCSKGGRFDVNSLVRTVLTF
ncbi:fimbrillin family protein [Parabacteroides sp.]